MSSITQNFQKGDKLLNFTVGKSLNSKFMDWLWEEHKGIRFSDAVTEF